MKVEPVCLTCLPRHIELHGRRDNHICAITGDIDVPWLADDEISCGAFFRKRPLDPTFISVW